MQKMTEICTIPEAELADLTPYDPVVSFEDCPACVRVATRIEMEDAMMCDCGHAHNSNPDTVN